MCGVSVHKVAIFFTGWSLVVIRPFCFLVQVVSAQAEHWSHISGLQTRGECVVGQQLGYNWATTEHAQWTSGGGSGEFHDSVYLINLKSVIFIGYFTAFIIFHSDCCITS